MFLGIIVFVVLAILTTLLAIRTGRKVFSLLANRNGGNKVHEVKGSKKEKTAVAASEALSPSEKESTGESEQEQPDEELRNKYAAALQRGITEDFFTGETTFHIESKTIADHCVSRSDITYLEFNNRELAGEDYYGLNLVIEDGERMVLTYNGQALVSITQIETDATAVINGQEVKGTAPGYRINTYPPELRNGMAPSDVEKMLEVTDYIRQLPADPEQVSQVMVEFFSRPENISRLKGAIDRKIQSRESVRKNKEMSARRTRSGARKLN